MSPGVVSGNEAVEMTYTCLEGFSLGGSNAERWSSHRKISFINNSVGLSMRYGPIKTVKYIWVNISCMLDWICHKTTEIHFICIQLIK